MRQTAEVQLTKQPLGKELRAEQTDLKKVQGALCSTCIHTRMPEELTGLLRGRLAAGDRWVSCPDRTERIW